MSPASVDTSNVATIAISVIRRSFHPAGPCTGRRAGVPPPPVPDLEPVFAGFRRAHGRMIAASGNGLLLGAPGIVQLTRHERRLLRATVAAQADDELALDNHLFSLAPSRPVRADLAFAVVGLATTLGVAGLWFATPFPAPSPFGPRGTAAGAHVAVLP